ncbi:MAG UNVERIFIED_CONTAM: 1-acyl-sn-glycerol-3-phosphate acyltransferase [Planctomycetaceae bacterium]
MPTPPDFTNITNSAPAASPAPAQPAFERNRIWSSLRFLFRIFCRTWLRVSVSGTEHLNLQTGGLLLLNHQSFLDPLVAAVWLPRPVCYLARDNLFRIPLLGRLLRNAFVIPISREAARTSSIRAAIAQLDQGFLVGIFPEGTRSETGEVRPFRPGFLALAQRTNQPIYPVGVTGTLRALPRKALWIRPVRIHIHFGPPLSEDERHQLHHDTDAALCEQMRGKVAECVRIADERQQGAAKST